VLDEFERNCLIKESGKFDEISKAVTGLALRTLTIDTGAALPETQARYEIVELSEFDINKPV
jgi:hypothetical protein